MGNKMRPRNEYRTNTTQWPSRPQPAGKGPHPELRIIQKANKNLGNGHGDLGDEFAPGWVDFLNHIGDRHTGRGIARSLGSVTLTIVSATEINKMMVSKHGDRFRNPTQARKLLKGLAVRTRDFIYMQKIAAADQKQQKLYEQLKAPDAESVSDFMFISEIEEETEVIELDTQHASLMTATTLSAEEKLDIESELRRHLFGEAVYHLPLTDSIQTYGRDAYGLDLDQNPQISDQRDALKTYFRRSEKMDVGLMDPAWKAHAVIFNLFPHYTNANFKFDYKGMEPPVSITFEPIHIDSSGDDDILFA